MRRIFWVALVTILVDQISKYWVVHVLNLKEVLRIDVLPPLLNFRMAWNFGINFGLFSEDSTLTRWLLIAVAVIITVTVLLWMARSETNRWQEVAAGLLVGGALGNVIDRLVYGAVADFLNMSCCGFKNPYAFNVADIAVFAGAFGLILFTKDKNPS